MKKEKPEKPIIWDIKYNVPEGKMYCFDVLMTDYIQISLDLLAKQKGFDDRKDIPYEVASENVSILKRKLRDLGINAEFCIKI
jgi:hypothetical protein